MGVIWMNEELEHTGLTPESFKDCVLKLERDNLKKIDKDDKKIMVNKIIRIYEEAKNENK